MKKVLPTEGSMMEHDYEERIAQLTEHRDQIISHIQRLQSELEGAKAMLNQVVGKLELLSELESSDAQTK